MDWLAQGAITIVVAIVVWFLTSRVEAIRRETERLQDERRSVYIQALEPYIRILAGAKNPSETKKAMSQITSFEYRRATFELNLIGSDEVVQAMNDLMQFFFSREGDGSNIDAGQMITLWGNVLLAIRRDVGNKRTKLKPIDMLRSQITDIDQHLG